MHHQIEQSFQILFLGGTFSNIQQPACVLTEIWSTHLMFGSHHQIWGGGGVSKDGNLLCTLLLFNWLVEGEVENDFNWAYQWLTSRKYYDTNNVACNSLIIITVAFTVEKAGGKCLPCVVDIREEAQIQKAVNDAVERFGGIDIVVNNASAIHLTGTVETPMKRCPYTLSIPLVVIGKWASTEIEFTCSNL